MSSSMGMIIIIPYMMENKIGVCIYIYIYWLVVDLPLWKMMEFVSWDDDIPNIWKNKSHVLNHQAVYIYIYYNGSMSILQYGYEG